MKPQGGVVTARYRLAVASRALAAIFGGYALTAAAQACLVALLPLPRADAVVWAMLVAFVLYTVAVLWVFYARCAARAWLGMLLPAAALAALYGLAR